MTEPTDKRDYRDTVFLPKTPFPMKAGLPQKEPGILAAWQEQDLYRRLRETRSGAEKFILHDGPPYANGDMHIGHALNHILKDMVCRTQSLLGKDAPYVPGWDCHGLPIEWKVEEEYRKKKLNKDEVPAAEFRAECRAYAQKWVDTQREQLKRLGINGDWDHPYLTMDAEAEGTIVAELMKFAESGQLYRGAKPVMWSPVEKTALAEAEVEYEDIVSTQIDVAFEIVESPIAELVGAYAVIWTTTPWTIPVNQAIAYGPEVEYVLLTLFVEAGPHGASGEPSSADSQYSEYERATERLRELGILPAGPVLIAKDLEFQFLDRIKSAAKNVDMREVGIGWVDVISISNGGRAQFKGSDLAGTIARHPMANHFRQPALDAGLGLASANGAEASQAPDQVRGDEFAKMAEFFLRPRPFLPGSFVTTDSGTGLVHMAPDHGEDDFELCKANGLEPVFAVESDGKYRADWAWLGGQGSVINAKFNAPDGPICTDLREAGGLLAASADYKHSYPHSWRSKAKVIYRCTPQWFVPMDRPVDMPHAETRAETRWDNEGGAIEHPNATLRQIAVGAIADTRFVPEKGRNRLGSMVEGRPDWVLSRQRAWGVPITLFVKKGTNQYLDDPAVNARIVAAIRAGGVDAWTEARAQEYLGPGYKAEDYERVTDILDVWFDSGCTHAFVLESGKWPDLLRPDGWTGPKADLYLEGSDQHRGWFQSSLLEACATRGHAPYKAVLTHGFTMDAKGMKMSKSLGNTINPLDLMRDYGADILRLWALSVDFTEDHRIGKEILAGVADQYRKLRNTFRYLLGALDGFDESERVADVAAMPELERYMLALLAKLDGTLRQAVADFDFNTYVRALTDFCNEDLSAFFFDIRKDCLYCDAVFDGVSGDPKRRAYRTVLDTLFHALVRYAAPVLVFTAEEVWGTRFPDAGSVHLLVWPEVPGAQTLRHPGEGRGSASSSDGAEGSQAPDQVRGDGLVERWSALREARMAVNEAIEPLRRAKELGSSLEAEVWINSSYPGVDLSELFISAEVHQGEHEKVTRTTHHKCGRCWRHLPEVVSDGDLCSRCDQVVAGMDVAA